jgi:hypothetical protein
MGLAVPDAMAGRSLLLEAGADGKPDAG